MPADTVTRRELLRGGIALAAGVTTIGATPVGSAAPRANHAFAGTLRVLGIGVETTDAIHRRAERELGFRIGYDARDPDSVVERAITQPGSFDVLAYFHFAYDALWPSGSLAPVDTRKVTRWNEISPLFRRGKARPADRRCTYGQGDAPFRTMYVDGTGRYPSAPDKPRTTPAMVQWIDERTGRPHRSLPEPRYVIGVPGIFNVDAIGYDARALDRPPERVSWAELLNRKWRGRVAIFGGAQIGLQDLGIATEAQGVMRFADKGDMTKAEIDRLTKILVTAKKRGQFHGFWTRGEPVEFMRSGDVVVQAMWTAHVVELQRSGFPVRYASPPEGFRGWSGGHSISSAITDPARLQAAYDYINWLHSGYAGSVMMRVGYYHAVQRTSRRFVDPAEWDYWIAGRRAARALPGAFGDATIRKGAVRDGGSFGRRVCRFASWTSIFRERTHQEQRWQEFVSA